MTTTRPFPRRIGFSAVCIGVLLVAPDLAAGQAPATEVTQQSAGVQMRTVAQQLGTKLSGGQRDELTLGVTLNGTLQEPEKLQKFGITGVHKGARVTAMRIAPQKVIVEVDEIDPEPLSRKATLRIDDQGRLTAP
jgi:hypothetical protein